MEPIQLAAVLAAVVLVASMLSVELGVTVALVELTLGVVAGNAFDLHSQEWLDFIASFASIVLTFLPGMEVDPAYLRRKLGASVGIGVVSFVGRSSSPRWSRSRSWTGLSARRSSPERLSRRHRSQSSTPFSSSGS